MVGSESDPTRDINISINININARAVVLLSGGLDSAVTLAIARSEGYAAYALSIDYGQRHRIELEAAKRVASSLGAAGHLILPLDLRAFGGSALTAEIAVPKHNDGEVSETAIPITYVPARNTIFLALALAFAETLGAEAIFFGANAVDYSNYPDCRPEFIRAFEHLARLGTKVGSEGRAIAVVAPLIDLSKADIIRRGIALGVDLGLTWSCYDPQPGDRPCGACASCRIRARGMREAGVGDGREVA
ncbi:MAG: 7-cyano-7-deazaguanine synthase QueC [Calditrichaeota bacterium]|nr:7-cyano-7-deazaguanine synthase QueC [Calditrichota bacterium]